MLNSDFVKSCAAITVPPSSMLAFGLVTGAIMTAKPLKTISTIKAQLKRRLSERSSYSDQRGFSASSSLRQHLHFGHELRRSPIKCLPVYTI